MFRITNTKYKSFAIGNELVFINGHPRLLINGKNSHWSPTPGPYAAPYAAYSPDIQRIEFLVAHTIEQG